MLGLIVGETSLPNYVINKLLKKNIEFLILDLTKFNIYKRYKNSYSLKITELGKAISILKKNNCKNVIFIGKVERPEISLLKFDTKALFYLSRLFSAFKKGDGNILKEHLKKLILQPDLVRLFRQRNIRLFLILLYLFPLNEIYFQ